MLLRHALLLIAIATAGCDKITGVAEQKISDAEAIGYACRVSLKKPEDCMKENESQSTTSLLNGWKTADKEILDRTLDPSMGQDPATAAHTEPAASTSQTAEEKSAPKGEAASAANESEKPQASEKKPAKSH